VMLVLERLDQLEPTKPTTRPAANSEAAATP
jgi:hypothetical protein